MPETIHPLRDISYVTIWFSVFVGFFGDNDLDDP